MRHQRAIGVEFELSLARGEGQGRLIAVDRRADLRQRFGLRRIDLARHDRTARLVGGQGQLAQPGARAGPQQADIVRDLVEAHRHRLDRAVQEQQRVLPGQGNEFVGRAFKGKTGQLRDFLRDSFGETLCRIEPRADRRAALGELEDARQGQLDPGHPIRHQSGIARKFLPQRQRRRILRVGTPDLDDIVPSVGLILKIGPHRFESGQKAVRHHPRRRDVKRAGEGVVRGLAHIDVIVGMDRRLVAARAAQSFAGDIRDHLVRVHVRLRARSGLPHGEGELRVQLACGHGLRRILDRIGEHRVEHTELAIGARRRLFDDAERMDDLVRHLFLADREVLEAALGLRPPEAVGGHFDRAHAVGFGAGCGHCASFLVSSCPINASHPIAVRHFPTLMVDLARWQA